eukprot:scaffold87101_cov17-Tisochrysis_lutea.AAC.1
MSKASPVPHLRARAPPNLAHTLTQAYATTESPPEGSESGLAAPYHMAPLPPLDLHLPGLDGGVVGLGLGARGGGLGGPTRGAATARAAAAAPAAPAKRKAGTGGIAEQGACAAAWWLRSFFSVRAGLRDSVDSAGGQCCLACLGDAETGSPACTQLASAPTFLSFISSLFSARNHLELVLALRVGRKGGAARDGSQLFTPPILSPESQEGEDAGTEVGCSPCMIQLGFTAGLYTEHACPYAYTVSRQIPKWASVMQHLATQAFWHLDGAAHAHAGHSG